MDTETRFELIRGVGEEIITEQELKQLVETNPKPIAYDGFEPSGFATLPFGVFRALLVKDLLKAGVYFKFLIADWHGWINNKMGGDLNAIQKVGEYFIEVWKAAGVPQKNVEYVWASKTMDNEYWRKVLLIAKSTTMSRANRMLSIMGRKQGELNYVAQYFYPMMQTADIFHLDVDICQLGLDQRRANMVSRELSPKLGYKKPVIVSHHMLMGLQGVKEPDGFETDTKMDKEISSKMSKSKPESAIFVHDSKKDILRKLNKAYCAPKDTKENPVLEYCKYIIFKTQKAMDIVRPAKYGGTVTFNDYYKLEQAYRRGQIHPLDLKNSVAEHLDRIIDPIRSHFEKEKKAKALYDFVKKQEITR